MKVAIVGAGIIGLYLAQKLAERREFVQVFERRNRIGKEACSGLFSDRILDFIPESKNLIQNQIEHVLIHFPKKTLKIRFSRKFLVMNHAELDRLAFRLAAEAGAEIKLNRNILEIPKNFDRVIGADGANSQIRKLLKLQDTRFFLGIQGFSRIGNNSAFMETWPAESGFIWKIPRGKETEYGIMENPKNAKDIFEKFLEKNNIILERKNSALIPQGLILSQNSKITICGDAAGLTKPWSGGGVIWGLTAADILLKNFPDFIKYQNEVKKAFKGKIRISSIIKKIVYFAGYNIPWLLPKNYQIESDFII